MSERQSLQSLRELSSHSACAHSDSSTQPALKPWLREDSVDSVNAKWRKPPGSQNRLAFRADHAGGTKESEKLLHSEDASGKAARLRHVWRWRFPLLASRVAQLEPLRLEPGDLDRELTTSPQTSTGTLPNGLTYFIRSCRSPQGKAELRLVFRVGSMDEDDDQLGLAHFVEHAAFIKLKSFDKGELFKFLESIGAQVGADLNAHTSFTETVYQLSVPVDDGGAVLAKAFQILRDWCTGIIIDDAEIERERNVVEEEWRASKGCRDRLYRMWMNEVLGHTRLAVRLPIGGRGDDAGMQFVRSAPPQSLRDFIEKNYRPELVTIVAVGDFQSHEQVRKLVSDNFLDWPRTGAESFACPRPIADRAPYPETLPGTEGATTATKFLVLTDPELTMADLDFGLILPSRPWARTARGVRERMLEDLWFAILQDRLRRLSQEQVDSIFSEAFARRQTFEGAPLVEFGVALDNEQNWEAALETLLTEVFRLAKYGVQPVEVLIAIKEFEMQLQAKRVGRHDMESAEVAASLVAHVLCDAATPALLTDEYYFRLSLALLQGVTAEEVTAHCAGISTADGRSALARLMAPDWITLRLPMVSCMCDAQAVQKVLGRSVVALDSGKIGEPPERKLPSADDLFADAAAAAAAAHPAKVVATTPLPLSSFVLPTVEGSGDSVVAPAECFHWVLSNGATVTLCRTSCDHAEDDDIIFTALAPGGSDECNAGDERALIAMDSAENGVNKLSKSDLKTSLTLANIYASACVRVGEDCRTICGSCSSKDLGALLDLVWTHMKRPRLSEVSLVRGMQQFSDLVDLRERDPLFQFNRRVVALTKGSDPRFQPDTVDDIAPLKEGRALSRLVALRQLAFGHGPASDWSFVLVGLLPEEAELRSLLEAKLGAFDAAPVATHVHTDSRESLVEDSVGADHGWLKSQKLTYMQKGFAGEPGKPVHEVIQSGMEDQSTTIMFFQCRKHPVPTVGDEAWGSEAAMVAEDRDLARCAACAVAEIMLRRELRESLGVVYSVDCGYDGCAPHTRSPSQLDTRVSVAYTSASKDFQRCVEATLKVLQQFAKKGPSQEDVDAIVEQYRRSVMEESQRNGNYSGLILDAVKLARCRGGPDGAVLARAADLPVERLGEHIKRTSDHLGALARAVTMESICAAARDMFSEQCKHVVVTLLPEDRGDDDEIVVATLAAPAPQAGSTSKCCEVM